MDVKVIGLVAGTHLLEDIQMDVPFQTTVVIPAEKACRSKDLWRAISAKQIFQLHSGSNLGAPSSPVSEWKDKCEQLEKENGELRQKLSAQDAMLAKQLEELNNLRQEQQGKLDMILQMLAKGVPVGTAPASGFSHIVVSEGVPTFIPSTITPENVETRIEANQTEAENPGLSGAAKTLRQLRQRKGQ